MSHLNGNWRIRDADLVNAPLAIGKALLAGSYGGGAGASLPNLGYVMASINAQNSLLSITAYEIFSHYFGGDGYRASGYKVVPIGVLVQHPGSIAHVVFPTGSIQGSIVVFVPMALTIAAAATQSTFTVSYARGASISANFTFFGFIASTP